MRRPKGFLIGLTLIVSACGGGPSGPGQPSIVVATTPAPPAGIVTNAYPGFSFGVASGGSPPFSWKVTLGAVPPGLALGADGSLTGTPTAAGSFAFTVTATDSAATPATGSQPFTVTINTPGGPVLTPGQTPPAGIHGTPYYFQFGETGGLLPVTFAVTQGAVPPGLTLGADGSLTGTPTTAGTYSLTVSVTDSAPTPATNSVAYAIAVSEPTAPMISTTPPPPTATVGVVYPPFGFAYSGGLAPLVWTPPTAPMGGLAVSLDGVLSGTPSTAGIFPITLTAKDALNQSSPATPFTVRVAMARPAAAFMPTTGSMTVARDAHTATLLLDGRVLIAGGSAGLASAELYDATSQAFTATGSMTIARLGHSATLLANSTLPNYGKVLVAGGGSQTAELFDPTAGTFTATGSMIALRLGQTATLLQNGQVLVAGGETASAELFNPSTGTFMATGSMAVSRAGHTATLLPDGRVLVAGGVLVVVCAGCVSSPVPYGPGVASAELYDPVIGTFTSTGSMSEGRSGHTATLLVDGTVLVTGTDNTAELFNPGTGTFSVVGELLTPRCGQATATLRNDSTVLVAGGRACGRGAPSRATAELFAPESGGFVATGSLITARDGHTATLLVDGTVLITGGTTHSYVCSGYMTCSVKTLALSSAELFK
jgi:hypothetical protein